MKTSQRGSKLRLSIVPQHCETVAAACRLQCANGAKLAADLIEAAFTERRQVCREPRPELGAAD